MPANLDFDAHEDYNPKVLTLLDKSTYDELPVSPKFEIKVPGFKKSYMLSVIPNQPNFFGSALLSTLCNFECTQLPDGVYNITYSIEPRPENNITKRWLRTTLLEYKLFNALVRNDLSEVDKKEIEHFEFLLRMAKSYAYLDNTEFATKVYNEADDLITKLTKCC